MRSKGLLGILMTELEWIVIVLGWFLCGSLAVNFAWVAKDIRGNPGKHDNDAYVRGIWFGWLMGPLGIVFVSYLILKHLEKE